MTEQSSNSVRLAEHNDWPERRMIGLPTVIMTGKDFSDSVDIIKESIGNNIPQGSLFAYLFRRFGFPNSSSDDFKELCRYHLTTTHPQMIMSISPYCGGDTSISISFLVPHEVRAACENHYQRSRSQHEERFHAWIESEGRVPSWADKAIEEIKAQGWPVKAEAKGWRQIMAPLAMLSYSYTKGSMKDAERPEQVAWYISVTEDYEAIDPDPGVDYRNANWRDWTDDDPMKPYAEAIHDTLQDLKRPVWIRDSAINPWGQCDEPYTEDEEGSLASADYAGSAGYPSGALANHDPKVFAELHDKIMETGQGDPIKGIAFALEAMKEKQQACST